MAKQNIESKQEQKVAPLLAKKDFLICQNEFLRQIREGEDISDVPEVYRQNLVTEGVI